MSLCVNELLGQSNSLNVDVTSICKTLIESETKLDSVSQVYLIFLCTCACKECILRAISYLFTYEFVLKVLLQ